LQKAGPQKNPQIGTARAKIGLLRLTLRRVVARLATKDRTTGADLKIILKPFKLLKVGRVLTRRC